MAEEIATQYAEARRMRAEADEKLKKANEKDPGGARYAAMEADLRRAQQEAAAAKAKVRDEELGRKRAADEAVRGRTRRIAAEFQHIHDRRNGTTVAQRRPLDYTRSRPGNPRRTHEENEVPRPTRAILTGRIRRNEHSCNRYATVS